MNRNRNIILITVSVVAGIIVLYYFISRRKWITPVKGKISSPFGNRKHPITGITTFHNGIDIAVPVGTIIVCPYNGEVIQVNVSDLGGKQIIIMHDNGYKTGYAHLSQQLVIKGEKVKKGQKIALSGNTGKSTGPHLHLTLTNPSGQKIDPESIFKF
jgi:murein DD-endopeptidase